MAGPTVNSQQPTGTCGAPFQALLLYVEVGLLFEEAIDKTFRVMWSGVDTPGPGSYRQCQGEGFAHDAVAVLFVFFCEYRSGVSTD